MTIVATRVSVTDTATALHTGDAGVSGSRLTVTNRDSTESIDLGPAGVTTTNGYELKPGETVSLVLSAGDELYGIAAAAKTVVTHVLKAGE